jgi:hypothetical protein
MSGVGDPIRHFLITYDIGREVAHVDEYGEDYDAALAAYDEIEERYRHDPQIEVVLLGADSLETIRKTHSSYFMSPEDDHPFVTYLRDVIARQG